MSSNANLPVVLDKYRTLAQTYTALDATIAQALRATTDPRLKAVLETMRVIGLKIARSFIALQDMIRNHPATAEAEFVARFYFMNYSIISENARLGSRIISYATKRTDWLAEHASRIAESLKTLYTDLLTLELECRERFRRFYNREISFDFAFREGYKRPWGKEMMSIETAFSLLGLPLDSSHEQVKAAFRKLAKIYHPDINPEAEREKFIELERAYKRALQVVKMA
jgi:hypothetical protein